MHKAHVNMACAKPNYIISYFLTVSAMPHVWRVLWFQSLTATMFYMSLIPYILSKYG